MLNWKRTWNPSRGGEGSLLNFPHLSRCLFSPRSGTALHCLVGVNSYFPLTWHWIHHLYLTSQGSGGRACSFDFMYSQQCTLIPFHCCPQPKANCPWETACAGEEPQILGSVAPGVWIVTLTFSERPWASIWFLWVSFFLRPKDNTYTTVETDQLIHQICLSSSRPHSKVTFPASFPVRHGHMTELY